MRLIAEQKHLTVENNLRNEFMAERADFFQKNGYETRLVYMLLPDIESSMDRVNLQVKKKGHFVDAESIRFNFEKGLENLIKVAPHFYQIMLVSGAGDKRIESRPELLITIKNGTIIYRGEAIAAWSLTIVDDMLSTIRSAAWK